MDSRNGQAIDWISFNQPLRITGAVSSSLFLYGPDRARVRQVKTRGAFSTTTTYVGSLFEQVKRTGAPTESIHYIFADHRVAIYKTYDDPGEPSITRYFQQDHLGSVDAVTDETGGVAEPLSYDAHGKRRNPDWRESNVPIAGTETTRGFTDHEHLDDLGLIHMNGRVYSPDLGRFLSPDPFIQFPESTQGLNRYTYAFNNPLSFTDPSGYFLGAVLDFFEDVFRGIADAIRAAADAIVSNPIFRSIATTAAAFACGPAAPACAAATSATLTRFSGASLEEVLFNAAYSAAYMQFAAPLPVGSEYTIHPFFQAVADGAQLGSEINVLGALLFDSGQRRTAQRTAVLNDAGTTPTVAGNPNFANGAYAIPGQVRCHIGCHGTEYRAERYATERELLPLYALAVAVDLASPAPPIFTIIKGARVPNSGGRLGDLATRQHVEQVATEMERRGWRITGGGGRLPENYLPGPGGARKGSSYPDITATKNGKTLRVNTIDTLVDGVTPTAREVRNAARIRAQTGEHLLLIPKP